jgi:hypothetical protein
MELKAKEKEEAEVVAAHKANHDSIVSEEKKKKQLEQGLRVVNKNAAFPSLLEIELDTIKTKLIVNKNLKIKT